MFTQKNPYSFGMELEISRFDHPNFHEFSWMRPSHYESTHIRELQTMPCGGREFMRRSCILGHMLGFEHHRGQWDDKAESYHLHMGLMHENPDYFGNPDGGRVSLASYQSAAVLLSAAHHMSRTGVRFRDAMSGRMGAENWGLCNNGVGTTEMRLNENPAPLIPVMLYPLMNDERFAIPDQPRYGQEGFYLSARNGDGMPLAMSTRIRELMPDGMFEDMIRAAKKYWKFDLVNQCLDMFVAGASNQEVWAHADQYFKQGSPNSSYHKMLREANI